MNGPTPHQAIDVSFELRHGETMEACPLETAPHFAALVPITFGTPMPLGGVTGSADQAEQTALVVAERRGDHISWVKCGAGSHRLMCEWLREFGVKPGKWFGFRLVVLAGTPEDPTATYQPAGHAANPTAIEACPPRCVGGRYSAIWSSVDEVYAVLDCERSGTPIGTLDLPDPDVVHIVNALNSQPDLVAACRRAEYALSTNDTCNLGGIVHQLRAALTKAGVIP